MDLRNFSRPILRKTDYPDWPYTNFGSAIAVKIDDATIVITAQHIAFPMDTDLVGSVARHLTTLIDITDCKGELAHFSNIHYCDIKKGGKVLNCSDITIFEIQSDQSNKVRNAIPLFRNGSWLSIRMPNKNQRIVGYGYPNWPNRLVMNCEEKVLNAVPVQLFARFLEWENNGTIGIAKILNLHDRNGGKLIPPTDGLSKTPIMDGFSGSPLYFIIDDRISFIGMIVSYGNGLIRFISAIVIRDLIKNINLGPEY